MKEFVYANLSHVLCILILVARLGDVLSTYIATPRLHLENNLLIRKLGWRFAWASLLICLLPYYHTGMGIVVLVPSLMVAASNSSKVWSLRATGEVEAAETILRLAKRSRLSHTLLGILVTSFFIGLVGVLLCYLCPNPRSDWGFWFGVGILTYAVAILIHGSLYYCNLFKKAKIPE